MKYIVIDGFLNGTGIRDKYLGGFIVASELALSASLVARLNAWLLKYETEHYEGYVNGENILTLDNEGRIIARLIKDELPDAKVEYYSSAKLTTEIID